jgi:hypothetical protein
MAKELPQAIVAVDHAFLYVACKEGGIAVLALSKNPSTLPHIVHRITTPQLQGMEAMNLTRRGNLLFVALGNFFQKHNHAGIAVIDIGVPNRPNVVSIWKSEEKMKGGAVVAVNKSHVYLGAMHFGVVVCKVDRRGKLTYLTTFQPDQEYPRKNPNQIQRPNARGMAIRDDHLFVAYDAGGLRVVDISNPREPVEVAKYINQSMSGKQQAYNNIVIHRNRAFVGIDYAGLEILDVGNPRAIRQIGWWNPWKAESPTNIWFNSPGHVNQLVYDAQRKQVSMSAGDSELLIVDVKVPDSPRLSNRFGEPKNKLGVWGLSQDKTTIYLAYINAWVPFRGTWSGIKAVTLD